MALQILPVELLVKVGSYLIDDKDLCQFAAACLETRIAIQSENSGFWRKRFASEYDLRPFRTSIELKRMYQYRRMVLSNHLDFSDGKSEEEQRCLRMIRDLVIETFSFPGTAVSNNIAKLRYFVEKSNLLAVCGRPRGLGKVDTLLKAEQLVFTHWSLEFSSKFPAYGFSESQQAVYSHPDEVPMFEDTMTTVNIDLLLHIANFFKYHITRKEEATLFHQFEQLAEDQKPRVWRHRIQQVWRKLGRSWKGSYAYLHDTHQVQKIRSVKPGSNIFTDSIDYRDGLQTLTIDWQLTGWTRWPRDFEKHLHALPTPLVAALAQGHVIQTPRVITDYFPFTGTGIDTESFHCAGILHTLPKQKGIPGWQRITMMKFPSPKPRPTSSSSSSSSSRFDSLNPTHKAKPSIYGWTAFKEDRIGASPIDMSNGNYWAYEGVVLPGGMIMLGRWWSPMDDNRADRLSIGPFIFWNVPDEKAIDFRANP